MPAPEKLLSPLETKPKDSAMNAFLALTALGVLSIYAASKLISRLNEAALVPAKNFIQSARIIYSFDPENDR